MKTVFLLICFIWIGSAHGERLTPDQLKARVKAQFPHLDIVEDSKNVGEQGVAPPDAHLPSIADLQKAWHTPYPSSGPHAIPNWVQERIDELHRKGYVCPGEPNPENREVRSPYLEYDEDGNPWVGVDSMPPPKKEMGNGERRQEETAPNARPSGLPRPTWKKYRYVGPARPGCPEPYSSLGKVPKT